MRVFFICEITLQFGSYICVVASLISQNTLQLLELQMCLVQWQTQSQVCVEHIKQLKEVKYSVS